MDATKCRLCLENLDCAEMFELFPEEKDQSLKLYEKVEYCCGVRIRQSPEMPSKICPKCFDITRIWFNFRQMCVNSQVYLESMCNDRKRPKEFDNDDYDESAYLNYLLQDLQTTGMDGRLRVEDTLIESMVDCDDDDDDDDDDEEDRGEDVEMFVNETESDVEFNELIDSEKSVKDYDSEIQEIEAEVEEEIKSSKSVKLNTQRQKHKNQKNKPSRGKSQSKKDVFPEAPTTYMCSVCGNVYNKKASFTYHMNLHTDVKPHECEICGKAFRQVSELKNHMRRHTGEKPHKCSYCERRFIDRSEKHRHERVHTNSRPYVCNVCGKGFAYSTTLKNHSKLHSGEKDYNCLVCDKSFSLQHQLKAHLQTLTHKHKETTFVAAGYEVVYE